MSTIKEETLLRTNSLYIENCPNIDGWEFLNKVYNTLLNNQVEIKYNIAVHSQEWNEVKTAYPVYGQYENNKGFVVMIWDKRPNHLEFAESIVDIIDVIIEYPQLVDMIVERPMLASVITEWPQVVNSLVETGKRNWLVGDGNAYINTDYWHNSTTSIEAFIKRSIQYGRVVGSRSASVATDEMSFCIYRHSNVYCGVGGSYIDDLSVGTTTYYNIKLDATGLIVNGVKAWNSGVSTIANAQQPIYIFMYQAVGSNFNGYIENVIIKEESNIKCHFVPFVHNGKPCMVDIITGNIHENQGTGQFTIVTEDK